jgi:hypothetical protein
MTSPLTAEFGEFNVVASGAVSMALTDVFGRVAAGGALTLLNSAGVGTELDRFVRCADWRALGTPTKVSVLAGGAW